MSRISRQALVSAVVKVQSMSVKEKEQLAGEVFQKQPHVLASCVVQIAIGRQPAKDGTDGSFALGCRVSQRIESSLEQHFDCLFVGVPCERRNGPFPEGVEGGLVLLEKPLKLIEVETAIAIRGLIPVSRTTPSPSATWAGLP
jgi:hypothetical protein